MQLYKAYNFNESPLGILEAKNEGKLNSDVYLKAVTCFVVNKETNEILIEKRTATAINPNEYDLVSGHVNGDEIGYQAIIRELEEEVGIKVEESAGNIIKICNAIPMSFESRGKRKNFFVEFFCLLRNSKNVKMQESEVADVEWKDANEVFRMIQEGETRFPKEYDYEPIFQKVREICKNKNNRNIDRNK